MRANIFWRLARCKNWLFEAWNKAKYGDPKSEITFQEVKVLILLTHA
jgi:hypothetical protein